MDVHQTAKEICGYMELLLGESACWVMTWSDGETNGLVGSPMPREAIIAYLEAASRKVKEDPGL